MRGRFTLAALSAIAATAAVITMSQPSQAATNLPVTNNWFVGFLGNGLNAAANPPGANDYSCRSSTHPNPVILVHGTWENQADNWQAMSPYLKNNGFCVFSLNYGGNPGDIADGWQDIPTSAGQLNTFIDQVRSRTGAAKVDLVGHSQGGMMPRYAIKFLGAGPKIDHLVGIAPSNHGTSLSGIATLGNLLGIGPAVLSIQPAAGEQADGSAFNAKMNTCPNGPNADTCAGDTVKYTVLETNGDQIVTPYQNAFLTGPNVTNITVQNKCPLEATEHLAIVYSSNVDTLVFNALDPTHPKTLNCVLTLPYVGG